MITTKSVILLARVSSSAGSVIFGGWF